MKKLFLFVILLLLSFSFAQPVFADISGFLEELHGGGTQEYLNIESNTYSTVNNRDGDSELELLNGLHTTCDGNALAISNKTFDAVTLTDMQTATYNQVRIQPVPGLVFFQKVNLGPGSMNACEGPFVGYTKFEVLTVEPATGSLPNRVTFRYEYTPDGVYTLTTAKIGTGTGSVSVNPGSISWYDSKTGTANYNSGDTVTLTAMPNSGSIFSGWSGEGCFGTDACTVTMDSAKSVRAIFTTEAFAATSSAAFKAQILTLSPGRTIAIDGDSSDWNGINPIVSDLTGDSQCEAGTDIKNYYLAKDSNYLYWRVDTSNDTFSFGTDAARRILVLLFYEPNSPSGPYPNGLTVNIGNPSSGYISGRYTNQDWAGLYGGPEYGTVGTVAEGKIPLAELAPFNIEYINAYYWQSAAGPQCDEATRYFPNTPPGATISGIIYDKKSPASFLANAGVELLPLSGQGGLGFCSDAQGNFQLNNIAPGNYIMSAGGWSCGNDPVAAAYLKTLYSVNADGSFLGTNDPAQATAISVVSGTEAIGGINFYLTKGATVTGTVRDANNNLLANVPVNVNGPGWGYGGCTNDLGEFTVTGIVPGTGYTVSAGGYSCNNNGPVYGQVYYIGANDTTTTQFTLASGQTQSDIIVSGLTLAGIITGRVTNAAGTTGIANVDVGHCDASGMCINWTRTDGNGNYTLYAAPGTWKILFNPWAAGGSYLQQWYNNKTNASAADSVSVTSGNTTDNINVQLAAGVSISGRVTNSSTAGIANVDVWAEDLNGSWVGGTATNDQGNYTFFVAPGTYTVAFNPDRENRETGGYYLWQWYEGQSDRNKRSFITLSGDSTINAQLVTGGAITGQVTNASNSGVENVDVGYCDANGICLNWTRTDKFGNYTLYAPAGEWKITFNSGPYLPEWFNNQSSAGTAEKVTVTAGSITDGMNAQLETRPSVSVTGVIINLQGAPIIGATVEQAENPSISATTDNNGSFTLNGIAAGINFSLKMISAGYVTTYSENMNVVNNRTLPAPYMLRETTPWNLDANTSAIWGLVQYKQIHTPIAGATVSCTSTKYPAQCPYPITYYDSTTSTYGGTATYQNGLFVIRNVAPGDTVTITASKSGDVFNSKTFMIKSDGIDYSTVAANINALTATNIGTGSGTISVNAGSISCNGNTCTAYYVSGPVTLTAIPDTGSIFSGWSSGGGCVGTGPCTVTMDSAKSVRAIFTDAAFAASAAFKSLIPNVADGSITINGIADDWDGISPVISDPQNDTSCEPGTDIKSFYLAKDSTYLYWRVDTWNGNFILRESDDPRRLFLLFYESNAQRLSATVTASGVYVGAGYANQGWTNIYYGPEYGTVGAVAEGKIPLADLAPFNIDSVNLDYWKGPYLSCDNTIAFKNITVSGTIQDSQGNAISGARVERAENTSIYATTDSNGSFTLNGIPAGTNFSLKIIANGKVTEYSESKTVNNGNNTFTFPYPHTLLTPAEMAPWNKSTDKSAIWGIVEYKGDNPTIAGAVVSCTSTKYPAQCPYTILYQNGSTYEGTSTSGNGVFVITNVDPGDTVTMTASKPGANFNSRIMLIHDDGISYAPIAADSTGTVSGIVTAAGGTPLVNVPVNVSGPSWGRGACTDSNGIYSITGIPAGSDYRVSVGGYSCNNGTVYGQVYYNGVNSTTPSWNSATPFTFALGEAKSGINFSGLVIAATVTGIVKDADGNPLANVPVNVNGPGWGYGGCTNDLGEFTVTGIVPGTGYTVSAGGYSCNNNGPVYGRVYYVGANDTTTTQFTLASGQTQSDIIFSGLTLAGVIAGKVTNAANAGIANVDVGHCDANGMCINWTRTDSNGNYTLYVTAGSWKILFNPWAAGGNYLQQWYSNKTSASAADPVSVTAGGARDGINAQLSTGGTLSGRVFDASNSDASTNGIANVRVSVNNNNNGYWVCTGGDGSYTITGILPGADYRISAGGARCNSGPRYVQAYYVNENSTTLDYNSATPFTFNPGETKSGINFSGLVLAATVTGTVTGPTGAPLANVYVNVGNSQRGYGACTNSSGDYFVRGITPDTDYRVSAGGSPCTNGLVYAQVYYDNKPDYNSATPVLLTAGQTLSGINFSGLVQVAALSGTLQGDTGIGVQGLTVVLHDSLGRLVNYSTTGQNGSYFFGSLAPGSYTIKVYDPFLNYQYAEQGSQASLGTVANANITLTRLTPSGSNLPTFKTDPAVFVNRNSNNQEELYLIAEINDPSGSQPAAIKSVTAVGPDGQLHYLYHQKFQALVDQGARYGELWQNTRDNQLSNYAAQVGNFTFTILDVEGNRVSRTVRLDSYSPNKLLLPTLTSPASGSQVDAANLALTWNPVPGAALYQVRIAEGGELIYKVNNGTSTSFAVPPTLLKAGRSYSWYIIAWDNANLASVDYTSISSQNSFSTQGGTIPPSEPLKVKIVPWVSGSPLIPHDAYAGHEIRMKAIGKGGAPPYTFNWDFGDNTTPDSSRTSTNGYNLGGKHTYSAASDKLFNAKITVTDSAGASVSAIYPVKFWASPSRGVKVNVAIDEALWWLHKQLVLYSTDGKDYGVISQGGYPAGTTALALQAFILNGHKPDGDPDDPYTEDALRARNYILSQLFPVYIAPETVAGTTRNPDSNGNGKGLYVKNGHRLYETGLVLMALSTLKDPTLTDTVKDLVDYMAYAQVEPDAGGGRGGWRYDTNYRESDMSVTQFPLLGLEAAEHHMGSMGVTIPPYVKEELKNNFLYFVQNKEPGGSNFGGFGYSWPTSWVNVAKTGAGLVGTALSGFPFSDPRVTSALQFIDQHWYQAVEDPTGGNQAYNIGDLYAMYAVMKGMKSYEIRGADTTYIGGHDWYDEYALWEIGNQQANGSWSSPVNSYGPWVDTAFGVLLLLPQVFDIGPTAVAQASPTQLEAWQVVTFSHGESFHRDSSKSIVSYAWDFNGDGVADWTTSRLTDTRAYRYPAPGTYTAILKVTDNIGLVGTDQVTMTVSESTWAPVTIKIEPTTFNLEAKGVFTASITMSGNSNYSLANIDMVSLICEGAPVVNTNLAAKKLIAKFNREDLKGIVAGDKVTFTVTGAFKDGRPFKGSDMVKVLSKNKDDDKQDKKDK